MACGRNREYNNTYNWRQVDCTRTNRREYKPCCENWDSRGFEWLEAMQAAAANQCEDATMPVCGRTGRDNYFLEIMSLLMALMHHHYHE